jgi:AraC-like DNA-binding protein
MKAPMAWFNRWPDSKATGRRSVERIATAVRADAAVHNFDARLETVQTDSESSFRCLQFSCDDLSADHTWHYHREFELTWVVRSQGTRFVGDSIERYSAGDLVLVGPNLPHCWQNDTHTANPESAELIVVQFCESDLHGFFGLPETREIARLLADAAGGLQFEGPTAAAIGQCLRAMATLQGLERLLRLLTVLNLLARSPDCKQLATSNYRLHNDVTPVNRHRIEIVHRYVRENLELEISQAEIAERLGMRAPSFSRFFRAATGQTFVDFVNILRVHKACRLLGVRSVSITDVAMDCGYRNISNFNRRFREIKHMSPSEYRRHALQLGERTDRYPAPVQTAAPTGE